MKNMQKLLLTGMILLLCISLAAQIKAKKEEKKAKPLVTFIELGSVNCVPCKMMQPVMKEIEEIYGDKIEVIFYDVWQAKHKDMGSKYKVRVIPTQVFLDAEGKEFHRHEGFYSRDEMVKMLDKQMGIKRKEKK